tara:strand:- start:1490 stop:1768 length:279 start_codon:yes stop_codon:yes gene_type:complete
MSQSIKEIITARLDKTVSRESLSLIVCVVAYLEQSMPAEWLAVVSAVLIAGLSLEKTISGVWVAKLAIQNAKTAQADKAEIVDTQDTVTEEP